MLYAPDYVINAAGIIDVALEYLGRQRGEPYTMDELRARIGQIPERLRAVWRESEASGLSPRRGGATAWRSKLIGRG